MRYYYNGFSFDRNVEARLFNLRKEIDFWKTNRYDDSDYEAAICDIITGHGEIMDGLFGGFDMNYLILNSYDAVYKKNTKIVTI